ncbi:uroporphyrinogen decarboxylase family protein [Roseomonas sp. CAU 1739]|uniref:uroporphyrinogen decarboxylase family protein n=1 Tax=Roseomonas sp. CAU 1739 TaxID=3140364 RepID=UPI00325BB808
MNRHDRLHAALRGGNPDRVPVSAWGHWYLREMSAEAFADVMVEFQQRYDWDFCKLHARASYHAEGFGFRHRPSTRADTVHETLHSPIATPQDWRKLRPLPLSTPALAEQLQAIDLVKRALGDAVPVIMTVFLPLDIAYKLSDKNGAMLAEHIHADEEAVASALGVFTETFVPFIEAVVKRGVDGIYFSTKWANAHRLTEPHYRRLARPFDLAMIEAAKSLPCNLLHLCEDGIYLDALSDYPVAGFHWESQTKGNPSPGTALKRLPGHAAVAGGVDPYTLAHGRPAEVRMKAEDAIRQADGRRFVLGPGCSILTAATPHENLQALRDASRS